MKQSEKDKIIESIESSVIGGIGCGVANYSVFNKDALLQYINEIPVEPDPITEVYAIKDCITGEVHWNAHGCPYKCKEDAKKKIYKLMRDKKYGEALFKLLTFKLNEE